MQDYDHGRGRNNVHVEKSQLSLVRATYKAILTMVGYATLSSTWPVALMQR